MSTAWAQGGDFQTSSSLFLFYRGYAAPLLIDLESSHICVQCWPSRNFYFSAKVFFFFFNCWKYQFRRQIRQKFQLLFLCTVQYCSGVPFNLPSRWSGLYGFHKVNTIVPCKWYFIANSIIFKTILDFVIDH